MISLLVFPLQFLPYFHSWSFLSWFFTPVPFFLILTLSFLSRLVFSLSFLSFLVLSLLFLSLLFLCLLIRSHPVLPLWIFHSWSFFSLFLHFHSFLPLSCPSRFFYAKSYLSWCLHSHSFHSSIFLSWSFPYWSFLSQLFTLGPTDICLSISRKPVVLF
jgi:hypothetical protein